MKKYFLPLLGFAFLFTPLAHADFPDVPSTSQYYQSVSALEDLGIVKGYPDGTFKLDRPVQRDELLKMAYLAEAKHYFERRDWVVSKLFPFGKESSISLTPAPFNDVQSTDWAAPYIAWGKQQGLINGYPDGSFKSMQGVNFAEAAKMLVETSFHPSVRQGEHWAEGYIEILGMGMIPSSIQTADQVLTRGQVADLIYNYTLATNDALSERPSNVLIWENGKYLTFECLGAYETLHFLRREGVIYWRNVDGAANLYDKLEGADAASFEVLESGLSKDKNRYYYYTDPLNAVIPNIEDLEFLMPNLLKDGENFYYFAGPGDLKKLSYIGSIPYYVEYIDMGKELFSTEYYLKDESSVYYIKVEQDFAYYQNSLDYYQDTGKMLPILQKVEGADPKSFHLDPLKEEGNDSFIPLDDNALYWKGEKVEGSAGGSFELLKETEFIRSAPYFKSIYAKDDEHVYLLTNCDNYCQLPGILPNSDAVTFTALGEGYSKDTKQVYFLDQILPEVNAATFQMAEPSGENLYCQLPFAKDVDTVFLREKPLLEIDAPTFEFLDPSGFFFKDKNKVYHLGLDAKGSLCDSDITTALAQADLATFKALGTHYFSSNGKVYYVSRSNLVTEISGADAMSFAPLYLTLSSTHAERNIDYAKDKNHAYYQGKVLTDIDAASFGYDETLQKWKDKNGSYTWQELYERLQT